MNPTSNWTSGTVNLTDDDANSALFSATNLKPGASGSNLAAKTNFSNGLGDWTPSGPGSETKVYKFTYTLSSSAPDSTQGGTAAIGLTWEAQNR